MILLAVVLKGDYKEEMTPNGESKEVLVDAEIVE